MEYILSRCTDGRYKGYWEVKHYWDDGVTIQSHYFKKLSEAKIYLKEKGE
jgi:hypothetical protein